MVLCNENFNKLFPISKKIFLEKDNIKFLNFFVLYTIQIVDFSSDRVIEKVIVIFVVFYKKGVLMKKFIVISCTLAGVITSAQAALTTSHTFFSARPNFQSASPERVSFFRNTLLDESCCNGIGGAFQIVFYGGRTTDRGSEKLVRYFLPPTCNSCCLGVKEYNEDFETSLNNAAGPNSVGNSADYDRTKDVEARHFNIVTLGGTGQVTTGSFSSRACFSAEQSKFGIGFNYLQRLSCKCDGSTGWWAEFSLPVERVKNKIVIREVIENDGGGSDLKPGLDGAQHVNNFKEAFRQKNWNFGRINSDCSKDKWGVADIEVKFGYNTFTNECANLNGYIGFVAPTGTKVRAREVFEPIVGNNKHWGVMFGSTAGFTFVSKCNWDIEWLIDYNTRYLFSNHQVRSFDLNDKSWSRYMEVYSSPEQASQAFTDSDASAGTSGINVFTTCFKVKPGFQGILNNAWLFKWYGDCWTGLFEVGFNLYARQAERLEIDCCGVLEGVALKSVKGRGETTTARTIKSNYENPGADISTGVTFAARYLELSDCDIDLESASHPAVISHTAYATLGVKGEGNCPYFAGVGASYEFQQKEINSALERWTVWTKFGLTF